jgi:hypothetical protein
LAIVKQEARELGDKYAKLEREHQKEFLERNMELQNSVNEVEKRRYQARNLGEEQVELLIFDKIELKHENKMSVGKESTRGIALKF